MDRTTIDRGNRTLAAFINPGPPGRPVVVGECGLGNDHYSWDPVAALLREHATVVTYDRAGYGASAATAEVRSLANLAADLVAVIEQTCAGSPVVIVGHSLGGRIARAAAASLPAGQLKGLVLLEGAPDGIVADMPDLDRAQRRFVKTIGLVGRTGLMRLRPIKRNLAKRAGLDDIESEGFRSMIDNVSRASFGRTIVQEWASMHDTITTHVPDVAAIELVAAGWDDWSEKRKRKFKASAEDLIGYIKKDFARLYPDGELREVTGTGHGIETDRPDAVAAAIIDVLGA